MNLLAKFWKTEPQQEYRQVGLIWDPTTSMHKCPHKLFELFEYSKPTGNYYLKLSTLYMKSTLPGEFLAKDEGIKMIKVEKEDNIIKYNNKLYSSYLFKNETPDIKGVYEYYVLGREKEIGYLLDKNGDRKFIIVMFNSGRYYACKKNFYYPIENQYNKLPQHTEKIKVETFKNEYKFCDYFKTASYEDFPETYHLC